MIINLYFMLVSLKETTSPIAIAKCLSQLALHSVFLASQSSRTKIQPGTTQFCPSSLKFCCSVTCLAPLRSLNIARHKLTALMKCSRAVVIYVYPLTRSSCGGNTFEHAPSSTCSTCCPRTRRICMADIQIPMQKTWKKGDGSAEAGAVSPFLRAQAQETRADSHDTTSLRCAPTAAFKPQ